MTRTEQRAAAGAARRRGYLHHADGDRRVRRAIDARRDLTKRRAGRVWITVARSAAQILATSTSRNHTTEQASPTPRGERDRRPDE